MVVHLFKQGDGPSDEFISSGIFLSYFCTHCEVRVGEMTLILVAMYQEMSEHIHLCVYKLVASNRSKHVLMFTG